MSPTDQPSETGDLPVIAYIRVASADADDQTLSVERQRAEISAAADRLGLTISQEFIDLGTSGPKVALISTYGEEPAARYAENLSARIRNGEFSVEISRQ